MKAKQLKQKYGWLCMHYWKNRDSKAMANYQFFAKLSKLLK